jgi:hypothetical protein
VPQTTIISVPAAKPDDNTPLRGSSMFHKRQRTIPAGGPAGSRLL